MRWVPSLTASWGRRRSPLSISPTDHNTIDAMCDQRMDFLQGLETWPIYGDGWTNRVEDVRQTAHDMVDA